MPGGWQRGLPGRRGGTSQEGEEAIVGRGLKEGLGVDWDILAFCTRDIRLPDGSLFGTLCLHHTEPREFGEINV